jgi:hypothetical protein
MMGQTNIPEMLVTKHKITMPGKNPNASRQHYNCGGSLKSQSYTPSHKAIRQCPHATGIPKAVAHKVTSLLEVLRTFHATYISGCDSQM